MKIYLAARYSRRDELREIRNKLHELGHVVMSQWLDTNWEESKRDYESNASSAAPDEYRQKYVEIDLNDILRCDYFIAFTEQPRSTANDAGRGGRHVEFGYAIATGKRLIIVGCRENLFYYHPCADIYDTTEAMLTSLMKCHE